MLHPYTELIEVSAAISIGLATAICLNLGYRLMTIVICSISCVCMVVTIPKQCHMINSLVGYLTKKTSRVE